MSKEIRRLGVNISQLKSVLLQDSNIDILLFLAKYNPKIKVEDITSKFGKESVSGLKALKEVNLVNEENGYLTLTEEGIFQVEGLLTLAV